MSNSHIFDFFSLILLSFQCVAHLGQQYLPSSTYWLLNGGYSISLSINLWQGKQPRFVFWLLLGMDWITDVVCCWWLFSSLFEIPKEYQQSSTITWLANSIGSSKRFPFIFGNMDTPSPESLPPHHWIVKPFVVRSFYSQRHNDYKNQRLSCINHLLTLNNHSTVHPNTVIHSTRNHQE